MAKTKKWWTALELAEAKLRNFPHSSRKVSALMRGARGKTNYRGEPLARVRNGLKRGKGGGWEYHIEALPPICQFQLYQWDFMVDAAMTLHSISSEIERMRVDLNDLKLALETQE